MKKNYWILWFFFLTLSGAPSLSEAQSITAPVTQGYNAPISEDQNFSNPASIKIEQEYQNSFINYTCPAEYPVDCFDGNCCPENTVCVGNNLCCQSSTPYYCGNNTCATSASACPSTGCPAGKILGQDNPKLENLRNFRDSRLAQCAIGRKVIQIYYNNADSINEALDSSPALKAFTSRVLEVIAPMVGKK